VDGKLKTLSLQPFYKLASQDFFFIFIIFRAQKELFYFHVLFFNYNWLKLLEKQPKVKAGI